MPLVLESDLGLIGGRCSLACSLADEVIGHRSSYRSDDRYRGAPASVTAALDTSAMLSGSSFRGIYCDCWAPARTPIQVCIGMPGECRRSERRWQPTFHTQLGRCRSHTRRILLTDGPGRLRTHPRLMTLKESGDLGGGTGLINCGYVGSIGASEGEWQRCSAIF